MTTPYANIDDNLDALLAIGATHEVDGHDVLAIEAPLISLLRTPEEAGSVKALFELYLATEDLAYFPGVGGTVTVDGQSAAVLTIRQHGALAAVALAWQPTQEPTATCIIIHYAPGDGWNLPAETSREIDLPCRLRYQQELVEGPGGQTSASTARVYLSADSGATAISIGDRLVIAGERWRVVKVDEDRDGGDSLLQWIVYLVEDGTDAGGSY